MPDITILPQSTKSRLAEQMGQSLAEGLAKRMPKPEHETIRKQQRGALDEFKSLITPQDTPADISLKFAQSTAGIPGAENWANSILPAYQKQASINLFNSSYGGGGQISQQGQPSLQNQSSPMGGSPNMAQSNTQQPQQNAGGLGSLFSPNQGAQTQSQPYPQSPGTSMQDLGLSFQTGMPVQEIVENRLGVPQAAAESKLQQVKSEKYNTRFDQASKILPKATGEELNKFMQIGQKYDNLNDADWAAKTYPEYNKYITARDNLKNIKLPGLAKGVASTLVPAFGLFGPNRQQALSKINSVIEPLLKIGDQEVALNLLTDTENGPGLSQSEAMPLVYPLGKEIDSKMESLPKLKGNYDSGYFQPTNEKLSEKIPEQISKFIVKNIKPQTSLLALREEMRRDKNYDWEQFHQGWEQAKKSGFQPSPEQETEALSLSQPPLDSLASIFWDWPNILHFIEGKK